MSSDGQARASIGIRGSAAWFREQRRLVLRHGRVVSDVNHALESITAALALWEQDARIRGALYQTGVMAYARAFIGLKGADGSTSNYSTKVLRGAEGFDEGIHAHLIALRHSFLAHSDDEAHPPKLTMLHVDIVGQEERQREFVGAEVSVFKWSTAIDRAYTERIVTHCQVTLGTVAGQLDTCLTALAVAAREGGEGFIAFTAEQAGKPQEYARGSISGDNPALIELDQVSAQLYQGPDAAIGGPDYHYGMFSHRATIAPLTITMPSGNQVTIEQIPGVAHKI